MRQGGEEEEEDEEEEEEEEDCGHHAPQRDSQHRLVLSKNIHKL